MTAMTAKTRQDTPSTTAATQDTPGVAKDTPVTISQRNVTIAQRAKATAEKVKAKKEAKQAHDSAALGKAIAVIQTLRSVSPNMTLNQALVFLEVARRAGKSGRVENMVVRECTGLQHVTLSHLVAALATEGRTGKNDGLQLIDLSESDTDGRAKQLYLTEKGNNLADKVIFSIS